MIRKPLNKKKFRINSVSCLDVLTFSDAAEERRPSAWEMVFVQKNRAEISSPVFSGILYMHQMLLFPAGSVFRIRGAEGEKAQVLILDFESNSEQLKLLQNAPVTVAISIQDHLFRAIKEYSFIKPILDEVEKRDTCPFCAEQLFYQDLEYLFIMQIRKKLLNIDFNVAPKYPSYQKNNLANLVADYIDKHITERITNQLLCRELGITRPTLCKIFMARYGISPIKYINQSKIQFAKKLIRESEMNFTQIADYLAFSSVHYFCKTFVRYESMTPTEYSKTVTSYIDKK